jgi:hypothetical protein
MIESFETLLFCDEILSIESFETLLLMKFSLFKTSNICVSKQVTFVSVTQVFKKLIKIFYI